MKHQLYKTGDKDVPSQLLDKNNEVVLSMCKICGKAESDLSEDCKSDREQAIEWWNKQQASRAKYYFTDEQIEAFWRKETHFQGFFEIKKEDRVQVDFDMLSQTIDFNENSDTLLDYFTNKELNNLKLFFELISKSSTFAHKAHKELNRLMK